MRKQSIPGRFSPPKRPGYEATSRRAHGKFNRMKWWSSKYCRDDVVLSSAYPVHGSAREVNRSGADAQVVPCHCYLVVFHPFVQQLTESLDSFWHGVQIFILHILVQNWSETFNEGQYSIVALVTTYFQSCAVYVLMCCLLEFYFLLCYVFSLLV